MNSLAQRAKKHFKNKVAKVVLKKTRVINQKEAYQKYLPVRKPSVKKTKVKATAPAAGANAGRFGNHSFLRNRASFKSAMEKHNAWAASQKVLAKIRNTKAEAYFKSF